MLRIIAGKYRTRQIKQPPLSLTRATKDRVRAGVFSALGFQVSGAKVLDLFAGSGAYGIEAYSRGASSVTLNDQDSLSISIIQENLKSLSIVEATVYKLDALACLKELEKANLSFDLIFLDPPYENPILKACIDFIIEKEILSPKGVLIVESELIDGFISKDKFKVKAYNYGRTNIEIGWRIK